MRRLEKENQRGGDRAERWGGRGLRNLGTGGELGCGGGGGGGGGNGWSLTLSVQPLFIR